jgi:hypothetical protein
MTDKFAWEYQVVPNGFVHLWKAAGWRESAGDGGHGNTVMKRDLEKHEDLSGGAGLIDAGLQPRRVCQGR